MVQPKFKVLETGPPISPLPGLAAPSIPFLFQLPADAAEHLGYTHILVFPAGSVPDLPTSFGAWIGHNQGSGGV